MGTHKVSLVLIFCLRECPLMELLVLLQASLLLLLVALLVGVVEVRRGFLQEHGATVVVRLLEGLHAGRYRRLA